MSYPARAEGLVNMIKAKIDYTQQNTKYRLRGGKILNEYSLLAQKEYKTRHNWVRNVIDWELCKRLKFNQANKWYLSVKVSGIL